MNYWGGEIAGFRLCPPVFCVGCCLALLALPARAQKESRPPPNYAQLGPPDQAEGRAVIDSFRQQGIAGDYYLEFELRVLPRRGDEQVLPGRLWGSRNAAGPISRVSVAPPSTVPGRGRYGS